VCRSERWNQSQYPDFDTTESSSHPEYWEVTLRRVTDLTGKTPAGVDSTGPGGPIDQALNVAHRNFEGYVFGQRSKQQLMEGLAVAIQSHSVSFPSGPLQVELEAFEYSYSRTGVHYCVGGMTKVLTWDLRWVDAATLQVGDELLAFDELAADGPKSRTWRCSTVTSAGRVTRPTYRIKLRYGTVLMASAEHMWLVERRGGVTGREWVRTVELRPVHATSRSPRDAPMQLLRLLQTWGGGVVNEGAFAYHAGYLAAAFDGEGAISQPARSGGGGHKARLVFAQRDNAMAAEVRRCLGLFGFRWAESTNPRSGVLTFGLLGRRHEFLRFLGQIRPRRLLAQFDPSLLGTLDILEAVPIQSVEYVGEQELVALGTTTRTFIADGFASHNSAPEGMHDDGVCALALAVWKFSQRGQRQMLETLLNTPAVVRHRGALVGGKNGHDAWRSPLDV